MGYVTHSQFRQCLSYLGLGASEEERRVVEMRFSDSKGFVVTMHALVNTSQRS